jgi:hypothetical protein
MSRGFEKRRLSKKVSDSKDFVDFIQSAAGEWDAAVEEHVPPSCGVVLWGVAHSAKPQAPQCENGRACPVECLSS